MFCCFLLFAPLLFLQDLTTAITLPCLLPRSPVLMTLTVFCSSVLEHFVQSSCLTHIQFQGISSYFTMVSSQYPSQQELRLSPFHPDEDIFPKLLYFLPPSNTAPCFLLLSILICFPERISLPVKNVP